jgi:hypothetical protein
MTDWIRYEIYEIEGIGFDKDPAKHKPWATDRKEFKTKILVRDFQDLTKQATEYANRFVTIYEGRGGHYSEDPEYAKFVRITRANFLMSVYKNE